MFQRLPIALSQVTQKGNSECLLNEIRHICLFFVSIKRSISIKKYTIT